MERKYKRPAKAGKFQEKPVKTLQISTVNNLSRDISKSKVNPRDKENSAAVSTINRRGSQFAKQEPVAEERVKRFRKRMSQDHSEVARLGRLNQELTRQNSHLEVRLASLNTEIERSRESSLLSLNIENMQEKLFAKNDIISKLQIEISKLKSLNEGLVSQLSASKAEIESLKDQLSLIK